MKRGRSTRKPTKAHELRFAGIKEGGCIVAYMRGLGWVPAEIHHMTVGSRHGQKRRGHDYTCGLNPYSHRGELFNDLSLEQCRRLFGPSYAISPKEFREMYPDDRLLEAQDMLLKQLGFV